MLVVPAGFDQYPPDQRVPHLGNAAPAMLLPAGVFAGHQPQERHERPGRREATEVMQLRQDEDRAQRIDSAEAPQPADRSRSGACAASSASRVSNSSNRASV